MEADEVQKYVDRLTELARQLNTFAASLKSVRAEQKPKTSAMREEQAEYLAINVEEIPNPLFSEDDLKWLTS
jgi:hypothetical protein